MKRFFYVRVEMAFVDTLKFLRNSLDMCGLKCEMVYILQMQGG